MSPPPSAAFTNSDVSDRSEQLPSVEEVKMMHAARRQSEQSISSKPSDIETAFSGSQDDDDNVHDQLPSVEDARALASPRGNTKRCVKVFLWTALLVIVTVTAVTLGVVLSKDNGAAAEDMDQDFYMGDSSVTVDSSPDTTTTSNSDPVTTDTPDVTTTTAPTTTNAPEPEEPSSRLPQVVELLSKAGVSSLNDLEKEGTPQQRAAVWVADQDPAPVALDAADALVERYAVTVFFYSTGGEKWPNQLNFLSANPVCNWFINGFASDHKTARKYGVSCSKAETVTQIHIRKLSFWCSCLLHECIYYCNIA